MNAARTIVGVDFDNTVVCYDNVFKEVAVEQGLVPDNVPSSKTQVRDYLRRTGREDAWTELQGYVYGIHMLKARPFPGVLDFFQRCAQRDLSVYVISHRTRHPFLGPATDLHQAARGWIDHYGLDEKMGPGAGHVFFELTQDDKLKRILDVGCTCFIDDLPEFLKRPDFPAGGQRILFDPNGNYGLEIQLQRARTWQEITHMLLGVDHSGL